MTEAEIGRKSMIVTTGATSTLFEDGFFSSSVSFDSDYSDTVVHGHGHILDFTLESSSPAFGFGEPDLQPADGLGELDENGFILKSEIARSVNRHNAGPWP